MNSYGEYPVASIWDERHRCVREAARDRLSLPHDPRGRRSAACFRQLGEPYSADAVRARAHRACPTRSLAVRRAKPRCTAVRCGGDATVSGLYLVCLGLAAHGAIDQIPRETSLASLSRPKRVRTARGNFVVHRLAPEVFGGFEVKDDVAS